MSADGPPVLLVTGLASPLATMLIEQMPEALIAGVYHRAPPRVDTQVGRIVEPGTLPSEEAPRVHAIRADLSQPADRARVIEVALARFGRIDHLINIAADVRFLGTTLEAWAQESDVRAQLDLNLLVPLQLASLVARDFWRDRPEENRRRKRSVVNVSSISGLEIFPGHGQGIYSASKAALNFLSLHMAEDYDPIGVRVNVVAPRGFPRHIPTEHVAGAIIALLGSDANGKIA